MSILTSVWNFVNIYCDQSKSNNALENQTKCCVIQLESSGVQLCVVPTKQLLIYYHSQLYIFCDLYYAHASTHKKS